MKLRTRVKRLEKKFDRYKPLPEIILVYEGIGESCDSKYQEYLDRGGDPDAEVQYLIYRNPAGRPYPDFLKRPDGNK